jgi:endonuclease-3|tara:strand:- start:52 stop:714 length:663 start_codon:yes stop_codon:yes gene_type:complete
MNQPKNLSKIISLLHKQTKEFVLPIATKIGSEDRSPFKVLISCILSLRTKDTTTGPATERLFKVAKTPTQMLKLSDKRIEKIIYPVSFFRNKTKFIKGACRKILKDFNGKVPKTMEELLTIPGIGRKCGGLTLIYGYNITKSIPVDTHLHRGSNRLGWVKTKMPEKTEQELMKIIPKKHWHDLNNLLVAHGQNICVPVSPFCSKCKINKYCPKIGVKRRR